MFFINIINYIKLWLNEKFSSKVYCENCYYFSAIGSEYKSCNNNICFSAYFDNLTCNYKNIRTDDCNSLNYNNKCIFYRKRADI